MSSSLEGAILGLLTRYKPDTMSGDVVAAHVLAILNRTPLLREFEPDNAVHRNACATRRYKQARVRATPRSPYKVTIRVGFYTPLLRGVHEK